MAKAGYLITFLLNDYGERNHKEISVFVSDALQLGSFR